MKNLRIMIVCLLTGLLASQALAGTTGGRPLTGSDRVLPLAGVARETITGANKGDLAAEDRQRRDEGLPFRYALPRTVQLDPTDSGTWEVLAGGDRIWRLVLDCPGALSVGLGCDRYRLPEGAALLLFAADGSGPVYIFDARDNREHGQLWSPVLLTDRVVVELQLPGSVVSDWDLLIGTVGWGYRYFGEPAEDKSGPCNIDVICAEGDDWREEIATVGVYTVGASWKCTGVMVNNTAQDERPLFLTAYHCGVSSTAASTVVIYWNFESPVCGQQSGGSLEQFSSGTMLRADWSTSDFTLLEIEESPDPDFGVNFAGWDRTAAVPDQAVCIHHPGTDEKSISFENDPLSITTYLENVGPGNSTHLRVADWDLGTTEGGSSGSPLFNSQKLIVGQLHGGYAACDNDLPDWYGRLYFSWTGGGTSSSRLRDWLDPEGLQVNTLQLLVGGDDPEPPPDPPAENANIRVTMVAPNPFLDFVEFTVEVDRDATTTARIFNVAGRLVADLGRQVLVGGEESTWAWGGDTVDGNRAASGMYILVLEADGKSARKAFTRLN